MWTFTPILKPTIWGGQRIADIKGLPASEEKIGESWEISAVDGFESVVASGADRGKSVSEIVDEYGAELLGERNVERFGMRVPLLVKFIDAQENLSVQVHPDDELAAEMGMTNGKAEMWYMLEASADAKIACGFDAEVRKEDFLNAVADGSILRMLRYFRVRPGDAYFIPGGRVHAIFRSTLLVEIQQTSDATFRIYDYNRRDKEGQPRELHLDMAERALNFADCDAAPLPFRPISNIPVNIVSSPFFTVNLLEIDSTIRRNYSELDSFIIIVVIEGSATLTTNSDRVRVKRGQTVLIAAKENSVEISPDNHFKALETFIA